MKMPPWIRWALRLQPSEFRQEHQRELEDFVTQELEQAGSRKLFTGLKIALDLLGTAVRLRLRPVRRGIWSLIGGDEEGWFGGGVSDLGLALRGLARSPGFSVVVVVTLALGVGLNTALFSVVNAVLLEPLEYEDPDELVYVQASLPARDLTDILHSGGDLRDYRTVAAFEAVEGVATIRQNLNGAGLPRQVEVGWVSGGFFDLLGVVPEVGRVHRPDDSAGKVVLGYPIWRDAFGADPDAVGQSVQLDGHPYEVIGVLPPDFRLRMPPRGGAAVVPDLWKNPDNLWQNGDIWQSQGPEFGLLQLVARLGPDQTVATAQAGADVVAADLRARFASFAQDDFTVEISPLHDRVVARVRPTLGLLLGAVSFVLLIACANVANLLLVRGQSRMREMAVRLALGSPRSRVGRFLLLESLTLAVVGTGAGLLLAAWAVAALPAFAPPGLPRVDLITLDRTVLGFALGAAFLTTGLVGVLPAMAAARTDPGAVLGNGRSGGHGMGRLRDALVVGQVSLSIVLLVGAGLLTQSLVRTQRVDPGFDPASVYTFGVSVPGAQYGWPAEADQFYRDVEARVAALPGVEAAGVVWPMPLSGGWSGEHAIHDGEVVSMGIVDYRLATEAYFPTARIPLVDGRLFRDGDAPSTAVVSRSVAERAWPDRSALGQLIQADPWGRGMTDFQVVGVVGDVRSADVRQVPQGAVYFDSRSWSWVDWEVHVLVRTDRAEASLLPDLWQSLAEIDADVPLAHPEPLAALVARQTASERFVLALLAVFAGVAAVLALVGLYGVVSYAVGLREREFGLRIAIGCDRSGIRRLVVGRGLLLTGVGVAIGLVAARGFASVLDTLLFEVTASDLATYVGVAILLAAGAIAATWLPAWRASRLDLVGALRTD